MWQALCLTLIVVEPEDPDQSKVLYKHIIETFTLSELFWLRNKYGKQMNFIRRSCISSKMIFSAHTLAQLLEGDHLAENPLSCYR